MDFNESSAPGIYEDVPAHIYHACGLMSHSKLKPLTRTDKTPAHFFQGLRFPVVTTPEMLMGTATHTLVLQPEHFDAEVEVAPGESRRNKTWKARQKEVPHKILLSEKEILQVEGMANVLKQDEAVMSLLRMAGNVFEASLIWEHVTNDGTVVKMKARVDTWLRPIGGILDLKTTDSVDCFLFEKKMELLGYHTQMATYQGALTALGETVHDAYLLAIEREPPHVYDLFRVGRDSMHTGERLIHYALETYAHCRAEDTYPGHTIDLNNLTEVDVPIWARIG